MEVVRRLVYPRQTMLDDVQIDTTSYIVAMVDMVHDNLKDLKLEVPPGDTTLTMWDAFTRRVLWRRTSIDIDPSAAFSVSTIPSQPNTSPASMSPNLSLQIQISLFYLQFEISRVYHQFQSSCVRLQFKISHRSLQLKSRHIDLNLRLRVPRILHPIRRCQR
jgi:hypothetical protein